MASGLNYLALLAQASVARVTVLIKSGKPRFEPDKIIDIASREEPRTIRAHVYRPRALHTPSPVLINFHGSGFILPRHGENDVYCRQISTETGYTVIDSSYRLSPEHAFPAALHDAEDVVRFVLRQPEVYDLQRVVISGFSAGGNLALALAGSAFSKDTFEAAVTFYPMTDMSLADRKQPDQNMPPGIGKWAFRTVFNCYLQDHDLDRRDPLISPYWSSTDAFPSSIMVLTAAGDTLCSEGEAFAEKMRQTGRKVVLKRFGGVSHAWDTDGHVKQGSSQEQARTEAYGMVVSLLRSMDEPGDRP